MNNVKDNALEAEGQSIPKVMEVTEVIQSEGGRAGIGTFRLASSAFSIQQQDATYDLVILQDKQNAPVFVKKKRGEPQELTSEIALKKKLPNLGLKFPSGLGRDMEPSQLFMRIIWYLKRILNLPEQDLTMLALYIFASWFFDFYPVISYLSFVGQPGSGKTTILKTFFSLAYNAVWGSGADSEAVIRRMVDGVRGTSIFEEIQKDGADSTSVFHKILTIGNELPGLMNINSPTSDGSWKTEGLCVFGPKIFGGTSFFDNEAIRSRTHSIFTRQNANVKGLESVDDPRCKLEAELIKNDLLLLRQKRLLGEISPPGLHLSRLDEFMQLGPRPFQVFQWLFNEAPTVEVLNIALASIIEKIKEDRAARSLDRDAELLLAIHRSLTANKKTFMQIAEDDFLWKTDRINANLKAIGSIHRRFRLPFRVSNSGRISQASAEQVEGILITMGVDLSNTTPSSPSAREVES